MSPPVSPYNASIYLSVEGPRLKREKGRRGGERCHLTERSCALTQCAAPFAHKDTELLPAYLGYSCTQANHQPPRVPTQGLEKQSGHSFGEGVKPCLWTLICIHNSELIQFGKHPDHTQAQYAFPNLTTSPSLPSYSTARDYLLPYHLKEYRDFLKEWDFWLLLLVSFGVDMERLALERAAHPAQARATRS